MPRTVRPAALLIALSALSAVLVTGCNDSDDGGDGPVPSPGATVPSSVPTPPALPTGLPPLPTDLPSLPVR